MKLFLDTPRVICYILTVRCKICQNEFIPNKYHPRQEVCTLAQCQRERQIQNEREWRLENPDYFKSLGQAVSWRKNRQRYSRIWKARHKEYLKGYEKSHKEQRREYMREYMRKYREAMKVNRDKI